MSRQLPRLLAFMAALGVNVSLPGRREPRVVTRHDDDALAKATAKRSRRASKAAR